MDGNFYHVIQNSGFLIILDAYARPDESLFAIISEDRIFYDWKIFNHVTPKDTVFELNKRCNSKNLIHLDNKPLFSNEILLWILTILSLYAKFIWKRSKKYLFCVYE